MVSVHWKISGHYPDSCDGSLKTGSPEAYTPSDEATLPCAVIDWVITELVLRSTRPLRLTAALSPFIERLTLRSGLTPPLVQAFLDREIGILISNESLPDVDGLERFRLFSDPLLLAACSLQPAAGSCPPPAAGAGGLS